MRSYFKSNKFSFLWIALAITLAQVFTLSLLTGQKSFSEAYDKFCTWDCVNYARIAEESYPRDLNAPNVYPIHYGFFPGLPLASKLVIKITGLDRQKATVLTSQLFAIGFWYYVLALLALLGISLPLSLVVIGFLLSYPSAFYLINGYSESAFLMTLLGFIYWTLRGKKGDLAIASLHGFVMAATRIVGLPLVLLPLLIFFLKNSSSFSKIFKNWRDFIPSGIVCLVASLGAISFFVFCNYSNGHWNSYMMAQAKGWGITPNYLFFLDERTYHLFFPSIEDFIGFNPLSVPLFLMLLVFAVVCEAFQYKIIGSHGLRVRLIFYIAGLLLFLIPAVGLVNSNYQSMMRYTLCSTVLVSLAFFPTLRNLYDHFPRLRLKALVIAVLIIFCQLMLEGVFGFRSAHFIWVS